MKYSPVAVLWSDEKPGDAIEFKAGSRGCVMALLAGSAKGKVAVMSRETVGCGGGEIGMGFTSEYHQMPGGIERFLSTGSPELAETEEGRKIAERMPDLIKGERYIKTPELARKFVESLPALDIPAKYVIFKPLELVTEEEHPKSVVFLVNPDQLSALVVLANYARKSGDNVTIPMGAGCHQIGIFCYEQDTKEPPKAIIGLTDLSARKVTDKVLGRDILSFSVPFSMFEEMEGNVEGSFLERDTWKSVIGEVECKE
jgi:uncharacterized protein (DUF169 family)